MISQEKCSSSDTASSQTLFVTKCGSYSPSDTLRFTAHALSVMPQVQDLVCFNRKELQESVTGRASFSKLAL